jgi:hypothetical protein
MVPIGAAVDGGSRKSKIRNGELWCVPGAADRIGGLFPAFRLWFMLSVHRPHPVSPVNSK